MSALSPLLALSPKNLRVAAIQEPKDPWPLQYTFGSLDIFKSCFQHFQILIPNAFLNLFRIRFKEKNNECAICNCKKIYLYFQVSVTLINLLVCDQDFLKAKLNYLGCCYRTDFQTTSQNHCLNEKQLQASLQIKERK